MICMSQTKTFNKNRIKKIALCIVAIVFFAWYSINRLLFFQSGIVERVTAACIYPVIVLSGNVSAFMQNIAARKQSYQALQQQNEALKKSYEALQGAFIAFSRTANFTNDTQEILEFKKRFELHDAMLAKILMRTISPEEHSVIINRGARDGVKKDMVGIYKLQIVGKVVQVTDYYSKIQLITDAKSKVAAHANTTGAAGILTGSNVPNHCHFNYVSYINTMQPEDLVFSSGQGMVFPEGFCLGKISKLVTQDKALYHEIEVTPLIDLTTLTYCLLTDQAKITLF